MIGNILSPSYEMHASAIQFKQLQPVILNKAESIEWVQKCVRQYPEILWLADAAVRKTEEGIASAKSPYSEQLFSQKFIEFDRTLMTLRCLQLIVDGSESAYEKFTAHQVNDVKLSRPSFEKLHLQGINLIKSKCKGLSELEMMQALETALILGDIGKSEKARSIFRAYGASAPDHDDFHAEVMQILNEYPELSPTFNQLPGGAKKLLIQTANLAHYGHIAHVEGGPSMFSKLKQCLSFNPAASLDFDFFVHSCDVAGALGHVNNQSSLMYTELTHRALQAVYEACKVLTEPLKTEKDAYDAYLKIRGDWLNLDTQVQLDRILIRVGTMLRLFTAKEGLLLRESMLKLEFEEQVKIFRQFDLKVNKEFDRTPTYMPAVLINLSNNPTLGASREERISQALLLGLPFLAKVLAKHQQNLAENRAEPKIPLNFNRVAAVAKELPQKLMNEFTIDKEGNVCCLDY